MSDNSFATLSPTLLARKGGARPAMRPQNGAPGKLDGAQAAASLEDLGWNDMGEAAPETGEVVALRAANEAGSASTTESPVRDTIERIAQKLEAPRAKPAANAEPKKNSAAGGSKRAAFTLRLDQQRHLKLRLACTVKGRSAQQIVTDALDALLAEMPEIDQLASQVKRD